MNGMDFSLHELVSGANEPALGISGGRILIANSHAQEKLGQIEGKRVSSVLPSLVLECPSGSYCASLDLNGRRVAAHFSRFGSATLCRLSFARPRTEMSRRSGLEHTMRTALTDLRFAVDRIGKISAAREDDGELASGVASLSHGYYRLARAVLNSSALEAIERGTAAFSPKELDLSEVIRELVWTAGFFAGPRGLSVVYDCPDERLYMCFDRTLIEQMLLNLLSNSLISLGPGGSVRVSLERRAQRAIISVDDNGCGMSTEQLASVSGGEGSLSSPPGIGLALVRAIAELHGGAFVIESRPGSGTSARVMLPVVEDGGAVFSGGGAPYRSGGMDMVLTQLSTWLRSSDYDSRLSGE